MKPKNAILILVVIAFAILIYTSAYTVGETEQVVVTQFGRLIGEPITTPGLKWKIPFIQMTNYFPKNILGWDGDPGQIPTQDKTYIWVDAFALWKIVDPVLFFQTVSDIQRAIGRLDDIIDPAVRNFVTSYPLIESVRSTNRELVYDPQITDSDEIVIVEPRGSKKKKDALFVTEGRQKITEGILEQAKPKLAEFGIELIDVKIKRINYVEQVRESVYNRMIAERRQIAEKFRSEGKGSAQEILGDKERDLKRITSQAYKRSQEIKGKADAKVTKIYADAYSVDPDFYSFIKTLELYPLTLAGDSTLILSTESEFLKYLKGFSGKVESAVKSTD